MGLNISQDFIIPLEEGKQVPLNEKTANEEAIYNIGVNGSPDFQDIYNLSSDLQSGDGVQQQKDLKAKFIESEKENYQASVADILENPKYDDATKKQLIGEYYKGVLTERDQEDAFISDAASLPVGNTNVEEKNQDAHISTIKGKREEREDYRIANQESKTFLETMDKINTSDLYDLKGIPTIPRKSNGMIDWKQWGKQTSAEGTALVNFFSSMPYYLTNLSTRWMLGVKDLMDNGQIDFKSLSERAETIMAESDNPVLRSFKLATLEQYADKMGFGEEFKNAYTNKVINTLSEGIQLIGDLGAQAGVFKNKEQGALITETALILFPAFKKGVQGVKKAYSDRYTTVEYIDPTTGKVKTQRVRTYQHDRSKNIEDGGPLNNLIVANPKAGGEIAFSAVIDPTGTISKNLNTEKFNILNDTAFNPVENTKDIQSNPTLHKKLARLTQEFTDIYTEHYFNPVVTNVKERMVDIDKINTITNNFIGQYHPNKSPVAVTKDRISILQRFGKNEDYMFYSRTEAIDAFNTIFDKIKNYYDKPVVYIEDMYTGKKYTPETLRQEPKFFNLQDFKESLGKTELEAKDYEIFKQNLEGSERELAITFEFNKEFDPLAYDVYGIEGASPKTTYLGKNVTNYMTGSLGRYIGSLGAQFDRWISQGPQRAVEKSNYISSNIIKEINRVSKTPYNHLLFDLLNDGYKNGKEQFTKREIYNKFRHRLGDDLVKNNKDIKDIMNKVYEDYSIIRKIANLDFTYVNKLYREDLVSTGHTSMMYKFGEGRALTQMEPVRTDITFSKEKVSHAWDMDADTPTEVLFDAVRDGIPYDKYGRQIVALKVPKSKGIDVYEYGLVDVSKIKIEPYLPTQVMSKVPGYLPIIHKSTYFIERIPTELNLNGKPVDSNVVKDQYKVVIGTANTLREVKKVVKEMKEEYAGQPFIIKERRATETPQDLQQDLNLYSIAVKQAKHKGNELNADFFSNVEDPLVALEQTTRSLIRLNEMDPYMRNFEAYFTNKYKDFLKDGEFPTSVEQLTNAQVNPEKYKLARNELEYYQLQQAFATKAENITGEYIQYVFDDLEAITPKGLDAKLYPALRKLNGRALTNLANKTASAFFIALNTLRQPFVQTTQITSWLVGNPHTAPRDIALHLLTNFRLIADAPKIKGTVSADAIKSVVHGILKTLQVPGTKLKIMDVAEFENWVTSIEKSGLLQSIDMNVMVHSLLNDSVKPLKSSMMEKTGQTIVGVPKAATKVARTVGFDLFEFQNRLFFAQVAMIQAKKQLGKDFNILDPKTQADIFYEGWRLSGSQTRQGAFDFQRGALGSLLQFASVQQKIANIYFQNNATILTSGQRARFAAGQFLAYGLSAVYLGNLIDDYIRSQYPDSPNLQPMTKYLTMGLYGLFMNKLFYQFFKEGDEPEPNIAFSSSVSPVGKSGTPFVMLDFAFEMADMFTDKGVSKRFPALQAGNSLVDSIKTFNFWLETKEVTKQSFADTLPNLLEFASGMSNITKGYLQLATGEVVTSFGNDLGLQKTRTENIARYFGMRTQDEENLHKALVKDSDRVKRNKTVAEDLYKQMVKVYRQPDWKNDPEKIKEVYNKLELIGTILTILEKGKEFDKDDIHSIQSQIISLDKRAAQGNVISSILTNLMMKSETDLNKHTNYMINQLETDPSRGSKRILNMIREKFKLEQKYTEEEMK